MQQQFETQKQKFRATLYGLFALLCFVIVISFMLGRFPISPAELWHVILSKISPTFPSSNTQIENIVFQIRLPRILAAGLIGAALSAAGTAYQSLFQNPLVSPDVLGASTGAGFGAALGIFISAGYFGITAFSFGFGLLAVSAAYFVSRKTQHNATLSMVLAGIVFSSLFSAATSFLKLIADPENILPAITYWLMGSLASIRWEDILFALPPITLGTLVLFALRWQLNVISVGDEDAAALGINTATVRLLVVLSATLLTAACVSISGLVGWVGLIVPHFTRMLVGPDTRRVLPVSMLIGSIFLVVVDNFARLLSPSEIPLGILTAFVGAPFFLYLLLRRRRS